MTLLRRSVPLIFFLLAAIGVWRLATRGGDRERLPPEPAIDDAAVAEAVSKCRERIHAKPDDPREWGWLGRIYLANGFVDPARECLAEAARLEPSEPRWPYYEGICRLQREPPSASECWKRAAECAGNGPLFETARLRWAEDQLQNDHAAEAAAAFGEMSKTNRGSVRARLGAGLAAQRLGRTGEAVEHLKRCTEDPSSRKKALSALAAIAAAAGDSALAAEQLKRFESLPPDRSWPDPFMEELLPYTIGRQSLFIQAEQQLLSGDSRQAATLLQRLIQAHPDDGRAYAKLGMILAERGDLAGAEQVLRDGIGREPGLVQGHFFLAATLFQQAEAAGFGSAAAKKKLEDSLQASSRAIELKPDHGFAHLYRGLAQLRLGRTSGGIAALREAVACTPDAADPHLHLGIALLENSKKAEGLEQLRIADRLAAPGDLRAKKRLEAAKE
jgi:Flp pilus assembly protein TadD